MTPRESEHMSPNMPPSPKASYRAEPFSPFRAARQQMNCLSPSKLQLQTKAASKAVPEPNEDLASYPPAEDFCDEEYFGGVEEEAEEEMMESDAEFSCT